MKKTPLLNARLSAIVAAMGHGDMLVIEDGGLPVPRGAEVVDLAVTPGVPRFAVVLDAVLSELCIERAVVAKESALDMTLGLDPERVSHEDFKAMSADAVAVVRTGEVTPYANVALFSGVVF
ncbi:MAG: RbsD/FucU domain-containing protein [Pseudomonadota bacterium]